MSNEFQLFDGKNLSSLFKDIYENQQTKKKNISELIESLRKLIKNVGEATVIAPIIKDLIEVSVKNDDLLIKMAGIVQRAMNSSAGEDSMLISDAEKEMLFESIQQLSSKSEEEIPVRKLNMNE